MKILKVCSLNYQEVIRTFYRRNYWIRDLSYEEHKRALLDFAPVHLNRFSEYMRELGHECDEVVVDLETLQHAWAAEHGITLPSTGWHLEALLRQIETTKPDILYMQDISTLPPALRRRLKDFYPFLRGIVVYRGFPVFQDGLEDIDLILTGAQNLLAEYDQHGIKARFLPHGFESSALQSLENWNSPYQSTKSEFSFLGYSGYGGHGYHHVERFRFLQRLLKETDLMCWLADSNAKPNANLPSTEQPLTKQYPDRCDVGLMGMDMYNVLRNSKVVFNKHSSAHPGQVENMRLFEATGIGACLLTDHGDNLGALFEVDREVVSYRSYDECIEKLRYLLDHPQEQEAIALAGQRRTLKDHTWKNRAERVDAYLRELF